MSEPGSWAEWGASGDETSNYRYALGRSLGLFGSGTCAFIGLNPSTATATKDDPTIRRCMRYASDFGCNQLVMLNLFAWRSTNPRGLYQILDSGNGIDPAGEECGSRNDLVILRHTRDASFVVAAWGTHGALLGRGEHVRHMLASVGVPLHVLKLTKGGHPAHPLYLPASLRPVLWDPPAPPRREEKTRWWARRHGLPV